jgi:hypothetical protein
MDTNNKQELHLHFKNYGWKGYQSPVRKLALLIDIKYDKLIDSPQMTVQS